MIRATQKNPKKTSRFSGSAPSRLFFFWIPRNKKWSLGKKLVFRLSHLKASKKKCKKVKLKSRVSVSGNSGATNRDTLCFVIVQFHLEDMVVEVLLKMPCVKHGIRGENANLFWCLEEPKAVYFPPKKKTGEFLINQWYPKMYAENSHALQVFKKFIGKKSHGFSIPSFKAFPEKNVFLKRTECKNSLLRLMKSCSSLSDFHTGTMDTPIGNRNRWWKFRTRSFCIKH